MIPEKPIRVLIVDDDSMALAGMSALLSTAEGIDVVGTCADGEEIPDALARLHPNVILCDIRMSRMDGVEAVTKFRSDSARFLMITAYDDGRLVLDAIAAGADGFLLKGEDPQRIIDAVCQVMVGESPLSPRAARHLRDWVRAARTDTAHTDAEQKVSLLTTREREFVAEVTRGALDSEIAARLFVAETTVKSTLREVRMKWDVRNRTELAVIAARAGLA